MTKKWTPQDDARLRELYDAGCTYPEAAVVLGRSAKAASVRAYRLGFPPRNEVRSIPCDKYARRMWELVAERGPITPSQISAIMRLEGLIEPERHARRPGSIRARLHDAYVSARTAARRGLVLTRAENGEDAYYLDTKPTEAR